MSQGLILMMPAWQVEINGLPDAFSNGLLIVLVTPNQHQVAPECANGTLAGSATKSGWTLSGAVHVQYTC
jgi:hypothetical protein